MACRRALCSTAWPHQHTHAPASAECRCCLQSIDIPLDGDDAAIKKYASQVEALKRKVSHTGLRDTCQTSAAAWLCRCSHMRPPCAPQVGMPSIEDVISAGLDHKMAMAGYNARKYLTLAQEGVDLGGYKGVVDELGKAGCPLHDCMAACRL